MINGRVPLTGKIVAKLSELFHINTAWLETGEGDMMDNTATAVMEPISPYAKDQKTEAKAYERIIKALENTIAAKDETILSQRYTIEALKEEVEALRKMVGFFAKENEQL